MKLHCGHTVDCGGLAPDSTTPPDFQSNCLTTSRYPHSSCASALKTLHVYKYLVSIVKCVTTVLRGSCEYAHDTFTERDVKLTISGRPGAAGTSGRCQNQRQLGLACVFVTIRLCAFVRLTVHDQIDDLLGTVAIVHQTNVLAGVLVHQRLEVQAIVARHQRYLCSRTATTTDKQTNTFTHREDSPSASSSICATGRWPQQSRLRKTPLPPHLRSTNPAKQFTLVLYTSGMPLAYCATVFVVFHVSAFTSECS